MINSRSWLWIGLVLIAACSNGSSTATTGSKASGKAGSGASGSGGSSSKKGADGGTKTGSGSPGTDAGGATASSTTCDVVVSDADCDKTQRPFVFVHGTYGSGDNFAHVAALLGSNGFCQDRIVGVEYNSLGDQPGSNGMIDKVIDKVLADNPGFTQVDLAGHSQGTMHCGTYLSDSTRAAKVAHYVNFSGSPNVGDVETLSLSSMHDLGNTPHHAVGNKVKSVTFMDEDHFAVAASTNSFKELYKYLRGEDAKYTEVQCGDEQVTVEGISETFADNQPVAGKVEIREVGDTPQAADAPIDMQMSGTDGHFGPLMLKRNVAYEFKGFDAMGKLVGYQYFTPFKRSNRLIRMLSPASAGDGTAVGGIIASMSTDHVVRGPNHVAVVARWSGGAFRQDLGASLKVDGSEVLTDENSGKGALATMSLGGGVVGMFMYDANQNGKTDLGLAYSTSFIAFTDVFMSTNKAAFVQFDFTPGSEDAASPGLHAKISNWPSSDALVSVMLQ